MNTRSTRLRLLVAAAVSLVGLLTLIGQEASRQGQQHKARAPTSHQTKSDPASSGPTVAQAPFVEQEPKERQSNPAKDNSKSKGILEWLVAPFVFFDKHNGSFNALAAMAVAFFTFFLWRLTRHQLQTAIRAANAAQDSADVAKTAQRAVMGMEGLYDQPTAWGKPAKLNGYLFTARWVNSGPTVAVHSKAGLIAKYVDGNEVPETVVFGQSPITTNDNITVVPQHGFGSSGNASLADVVKSWEGKGHLFLLARVEYVDVFDAPHHTQVCSRVQVVNDPTVYTPGQKGPPLFHYVIWKEHNSSD